MRRILCLFCLFLAACSPQPVDVAAIPEPGAWGLDPTALYLG